MIEFPIYTKNFGPGKYETFSFNLYKLCSYKKDNSVRFAEYVIFPTISFSTMNKLSYTFNFMFLCWKLSLTYWKIKWLKPNEN